MKILLVEDRTEDAELAKMALSNVGYEGVVDWKQDGEKANDYLFEEGNSHEDLKLILLDINIPKINGLEILRKLKNSALKHIPVVVLTTSEHPNDVNAAYNNHVNSYIKKPVNFEEFEKTFEKMYKYWIEVNLNKSY